MPTNWPPATAPPWPPAELNIGSWESSDIISLARDLKALGFTQSAPTTAERSLYFNSARCDHGHGVTGRMIISPGGVRYPFAVCNNAAHRDLLVLWPPYYAGCGSGVE
jgi:hypothetical protein